MAAVDDVRIGLVPESRIVFHPHNVRRDLGDLRSLTASIREHGLLQPIVVERWGEQLRVRAGHRRLAACRLAGMKRIPAVVHGDALDEVGWLRAAVAENVIRAEMELAERVDAADALLAKGLTAGQVAAAFGTTTLAVRTWRKKVARAAYDRAQVIDPDRAKRRPPRVVSVTKVRTAIDEAAALVDAGELDAHGVIARLRDLLPAEPAAAPTETEETPDA